MLNSGFLLLAAVVQVESEAQQTQREGWQGPSPGGDRLGCLVPQRFLHRLSGTLHTDAWPREGRKAEHSIGVPPRPTAFRRELGLQGGTTGYVGGAALEEGGMAEGISCLHLACVFRKSAEDRDLHSHPEVRTSRRAAVLCHRHGGLLGVLHLLLARWSPWQCG